MQRPASLFTARRAERSSTDERSAAPFVGVHVVRQVVHEFGDALLRRADVAGLQRDGHRLGAHPVLPFAQPPGDWVVFSDERVMDVLNVLDGDLSATDRHSASVTRRGDISECLYLHAGRLLAERAELRLGPTARFPPENHCP